MFDKWKKVLPKRERELMTNSAVCSKHFEESQIVREWTSGHIKVISLFMIHLSILIISQTLNKSVLVPCTQIHVRI